MAASLRAAVLLVPAAVSTGVIGLVDRLLPVPGRWEAFGAEAVLDVVVGVAVVLAVDRLARRLLPLATLLTIAQAFPDRAPQRFSAVLRANASVARKAGAGAVRSPAAGAAAGDRGDGWATGPPIGLVDLLVAVARHDRSTRGHSERVRGFVDLLTAEMGLTPEDQERMRWVALVHDAGKLTVPTTLLRKPSRPTAAEWERLKQHPAAGAAMVEPMRPWLGPWTDAVGQHHERWDGGGYPSGLAGERISLGGRILAVADAYEVMVTPRPYKRAVSAEVARRELVRCAGAQFDPAVVRAFLRVSIGDLRRAMGVVGVLTDVPVLLSLPRAGAVVGALGQPAAGLAVAATTGALAVAGVLAPAPAGPRPARPVSAAAPAPSARSATPAGRPSTAATSAAPRRSGERPASTAGPRAADAGGAPRSAAGGEGSTAGRSGSVVGGVGSAVDHGGPSAVGGVRSVVGGAGSAVGGGPSAVGRGGPSAVGGGGPAVGRLGLLIGGTDTLLGGGAGGSSTATAVTSGPTASGLGGVAGGLTTTGSGSQAPGGSSAAGTPSPSAASGTSGTGSASGGVHGGLRAAGTAGAGAGR